MRLGALVLALLASTPAWAQVGSLRPGAATDVAARLDGVEKALNKLGPTPAPNACKAISDRLVELANIDTPPVNRARTVKAMGSLGGESCTGEATVSAIYAQLEATAKRDVSTLVREAVIAAAYDVAKASPHRRAELIALIVDRLVTDEDPSVVERAAQHLNFVQQRKLPIPDVHRVAIERAVVARVEAGRGELAWSGVARVPFPLVDMEPAVRALLQGPLPESTSLYYFALRQVHDDLRSPSNKDDPQRFARLRALAAVLVVGAPRPAPTSDAEPNPASTTPKAALEQVLARQEKNEERLCRSLRESKSLGASGDSLQASVCKKYDRKVALIRCVAARQVGASGGMTAAQRRVLPEVVSEMCSAFSPQEISEAEGEDRARDLSLSADIARIKDGDTGDPAKGRTADRLAFEARVEKGHGDLVAKQIVDIVQRRGGTAGALDLSLADLAVARTVDPLVRADVAAALLRVARMGPKEDWRGNRSAAVAAAARSERDGKVKKLLVELAREIKSVAKTP